MRAIFICLIALFALGLYAVEAVDYEAKLHELQSLEERGIKNPDLYFNIGVCHFHLDSHGYAALYFLKALNLDSAHTKARENLEYVLDRSPDKVLYPSHSYLASVFLRLYNYLNINRMALLCLILAMIFGIALHWFLHYDPAREKGLPLLVLMLCAMLLAVNIIMLVTKYRRMVRNPKAVVIARQSDAFDGSGDNYNRLFGVHEALLVQVEIYAPDYCLVNLPNGSSGWIKTADLAFVNQPKR